MNCPSKNYTVVIFYGIINGTLQILISFNHFFAPILFLLCPAMFYIL